MKFRIYYKLLQWTDENDTKLNKKSHEPSLKYNLQVL
jgi:hypothetical protein